MCVQREGAMDVRDGKSEPLVGMISWWAYAGRSRWKGWWRTPRHTEVQEEFEQDFLSLTFSYDPKVPSEAFPCPFSLVRDAQLRYRLMTQHSVGMGSELLSTQARDGVFRGSI